MKVRRYTSDRTVLEFDGSSAACGDRHVEKVLFGGTAELLDAKHASGRTALKFDGGGERHPVVTTSGSDNIVDKTLRRNTIRIKGRRKRITSFTS
ncbi:hypothetical protein OROMI_017192 [Orobanche minor]